MAAPRDTIWTLEPHTAAKHDLLRHYLKAWYPILARHSGRVIFLDGFAGPGIYKGGQSGSPIIAINTLLEHSYFPNLNECEFVFLFIENNSERLGRLETELRGLYPLPSNINVETIEGEFQDVIEEIVGKLAEEEARLAPTLAFIDPFGFSGVPMDTIRRFLSAPKCELIMILMVDHLNRFKSHSPVKMRFETLYGTVNFDGVEAADDAVPVLVEKYKSQLKRVAGFSFALDFQMVRSDGHDAYFIIYATRNITGVRKFKDAMWTVDPAGGQQFSDMHWNQVPLFTGSNVDTTLLQQELSKEFSGKTVGIEEIEEYVLLKTPYKESHIRRMTLVPLETAGRIVVVESTKNRRISTFPPGTKILFQPTLGI